MTNSTPLKEKRSIDELVIRAQQGDGYVLDDLLLAYQPFIAKSISEVCKRYIDPKRDDEYSIGLAAFNEAIMSYVPERGTFFSFAKLVVKRKTIDYIRSNQRHLKTVSFDETFDEEQMENPIEIAVVKELYSEEKHAEKRRDEISMFQERLQEYNLSLNELVKVSPKHRDARESAISVARILYSDQNLRLHVQTKHKLPIKELLNYVKVSKKTLERNRRYILAVFIVLDSEFLYLKEYLKGIGL